MSCGSIKQKSTRPQSPRGLTMGYFNTIKKRKKEKKAGGEAGGWGEGKTSTQAQCFRITTEGMSLLERPRLHSNSKLPILTRSHNSKTARYKK